MEYRNDIQGLRAIAFMFVFLFHLRPDWLPGGYIGVDIFFVISGFLMGSIILKKKDSGTFGYLDFYFRRIKRITPVYFLMLIVITVVAYFIYLPTDVHALHEWLISAQLFVSNAEFAHGDSYFGAASHENPLLHTWSLAVEMQFYLFLPPLLLYTRKKYLPATLIGIIVILTTYASWGLYIDQQKTKIYFSLLARMPEFLVGVLCCFYAFKMENTPLIWQNIFSIAGVSGLLATAFYLNENSNFPGILALIPCISTGSILLCRQSVVSKLLKTKTLIIIGAWSYSLYLWHWPVMAFLRYQFVPFDWQYCIWITLATFGLSIISYYGVENVFRQFKARRFVYSIAAMIALCMLSGNYLVVYGQTKSIPEYYTTPVFGVRSHHHPTVETFGKMGNGLQKKLLLIGNSHANMTKPFLDEIGKRYGFSFRTVTTSSYPAIEGIKREDIVPAEYETYETAVAMVGMTWKEITKADIILINMHDFCFLPSMRQALEDLIKKLRSNQRIVLLKTFPRMDLDPLRINYSLKRITPRKFRTVDNSCSEEFVDYFDDKYDQVYSYDLGKSKVFDDAPFYNDTLAYYDSRHINTYGSIALGKDLSEDFFSFLKRIK